MFVKTKKKGKEKHKEQKQQRKKEKEKERERINQLKIKEEQRKIEKKKKQVLWTRRCLNNMQNYRKEKRGRRAIVTWLRHGGCKGIARLVTNQIFVSALLFHTKQKRKEKGKVKGQNDQSQNFLQNTTL